VDSEITTIQGYPPVMTGFGMSERSVLPLATRAAFDSADRWKSLLPGAANRQPFLLAGHSLFGVLAGLLGSLVAIWFKDRDKCVGSASS
jgi:hypothetical protein